MEFCFKKNSGLSLPQTMSSEWLETNGIGGYSSSSIINCHTRKYHGLLVSKLESLPGRYVLLSKIEDTFNYNKQKKYLSAHFYPNHLEDGSFDEFEEFFQDTHPCFKYSFEDTKVVKEILMPLNENTILIKYWVENCDKEAKITIRPLVAMRHFHTLSKENADVQAAVTPCKNGISITPYKGMPTLFLQSDTTFQFQAEPLWYRNFVYEKERERGYDFMEDLYAPGVFTFELKPKKTCQQIVFSCSINEMKDSLQNKWKLELNRRKKLETAFCGTRFQRQLQKVGTSFIEQNFDSKPTSIIAGYHWFLEWGRDAMIALPGVTLFSGREKLCLEILKEYSKQEQNGLMPNYLGLTKEQNSYNSVDASLWFAWAVQHYYYKTKDIEGVVQYLWPTLKNIYQNYYKGTWYEIKMHENGLLYAGNKNTNLTWMDAQVNAVPVTPRYGYAVEINALWYNMLCFMLELANKIFDSIKHEIEPIVSSLKTTFCKTFWHEEKNYLYDYVNAEEKNSSIRPNQLIAASLFYSPLPKEYIAKIVAVAIEHLLTPYGLRTLSPHDKYYMRKYRGSQEDRDRAYHNGVIWPWLLGPFGDAFLKITQDQKKLAKVVKPILEALEVHLYKAGIGTISEFFAEEDLPQPDGCISQAWSVAEVLRLSYLIKS